MKYFLISIFAILSIGLKSQSLFVNAGWANSLVNGRSEVYQMGNPTNMDGNRYVVGWLKTDKHYCMMQDTITFTKLGTSGFPIVTTDASGMLKTIQKWSLIDTAFLSTRYWADNRYLQSYTESDPTIYSWAKASTKPSYNYSEIGSTPTIPTNTNQLTNGAGFITSVPAQSWSSITGKPTLSTVATSGSYNDLSNKPTIPTIKRQETYSGTTNGSGNYTVTFGTSYSVAPNIQVCLISPNVRDTPIVTVSTTGFTVNIQRRTDVLGLLPTYANVVSGAVDVLITEK